MTDTVVAEGQVKFRDGKKWKSRWVVLRKPSPVADCLSLLVFKDKKKDKEKARAHKERLNVTLEGICGVEPGPGFDGVAYTLTIFCLGQSLSLGFQSRDALLAWDTRLRYSLGEVHRFSVTVQPGTKLESGPASLHLCNNLLVLTRDLPPVVIGQWKLSELRRYGAVPNGFVFEGGTRCGYWAGVFFLSCTDGEQISFLFDCIVRGISPSRAPHSLRPVLPDPSVNPSSSEERISLEASELERRLSMLSQCSQQSSAASTYSCSTSVAGDDRSSISSSSSSQSDASYSSRHPLWAEPANRAHLSTETLLTPSTPKGLSSPDDRLYAAVMGGSMICPSSKPLCPRGLHDSGRQSSLDSGIGITAGSQSSCSGSFSSCTGSLDTASQGGGEGYGSLLSLPSGPPPPHPPPLPPPTPPLISQGPQTPTGIPEQRPLSPTSWSSPSRPTSSASTMSHSHSEDYQAPSLLRVQYDVPRSLLSSLTLTEHPPQEGPPDPGKDRESIQGGGQGLGHRVDGTEPSLHGARAQHPATMQRSHSWGSERVPSVDSVGRCTPKSPLQSGCPVCGVAQCGHGLENYITPEQWQSASTRGLTQVTNSSQSELSSTVNTTDALHRPREEKDSRDGNDDDVGSGGLGVLERPEPPVPISVPTLPTSVPTLPTSVPPLPPSMSSAGPRTLNRQTSLPDPRPAFEQIALPKREPRLDEHKTLFLFPSDAPFSPSLDTRLRCDNTANYVNIPISPLAKKPTRELLYMELDLHEPNAAPVSSLPTAVRGNTLQLCRPKGGSTRYAYIDIAAMETAQRVGAEHAQGREDRLTQLGNRRRGTPQ